MLKPAGIPSGAVLPSPPRMSSTALMPAGIPRGASAQGASSGGGGGSDRERDRRGGRRLTDSVRLDLGGLERPDERVGIDRERDALATCLLEERLEIGTLPLDSHASVLDPLVAVSA